MINYAINLLILILSQLIYLLIREEIFEPV